MAAIHLLDNLPLIDLRKLHIPLLNFPPFLGGGLYFIYTTVIILLDHLLFDVRKLYFSSLLPYWWSSFIIFSFALPAVFSFKILTSGTIFIGRVWSTGARVIICQIVTGCVFFTIALYLFSPFFVFYFIFLMFFKYFTHCWSSFYQSSPEHK